MAPRKPRKADARRKKAPAQRRSKHQATWLREQLAREFGADFNPVLEMARIAQKKEIEPADRERFSMLRDYAPFVQPKLRATIIDLPDDKDGALVISWKS